MDNRKKVKSYWKTFHDERKCERKKFKEEKMLKVLKKSQQPKIQVTEQVSQPHTSQNESNDSSDVPTISFAVPGAILDNAQSQELKTILSGQIARAASVCRVSEVVIYDENGTSKSSDLDVNGGTGFVGSNPNAQMARILQYLECPQYLRKYYFPEHKDLKHVGLLPPLDSPHHLRESDESTFREGVVLERPVKAGHGPFVYVGIQKDVQVYEQLEAGLRVTVRLKSPPQKKKKLSGNAVPPHTPCKEEGLYWGYTVRLAHSLSAVFTECSYQGGYDLTIGTSDKGDNVDDLKELQPFKHLLVVFGGLKGLEYALECDESLPLEDPRFLFHHYLNAYPNQGSRTIRTEEAILLTMAALRPKIQAIPISSS